MSSRVEEHSHVVGSQILHCIPLWLCFLSAFSRVNQLILTFPSCLAWIDTFSVSFKSLEGRKFTASVSLPPAPGGKYCFPEECSQTDDLFINLLSQPTGYSSCVLLLCVMGELTAAFGHSLSTEMRLHVIWRRLSALLPARMGVGVDLLPDKEQQAISVASIEVDSGDSDIRVQNMEGGIQMFLPTQGLTQQTWLGWELTSFTMQSLWQLSTGSCPHFHLFTESRASVRIKCSLALMPQ